MNTKAALAATGVLFCVGVMVAVLMGSVLARIIAIVLALLGIWFLAYKGFCMEWPEKKR